jgi:hypothetical protein
MVSLLGRRNSCEINAIFVRAPNITAYSDDAIQEGVVDLF